jgi:ankyrin repeat protein
MTDDGATPLLGTSAQGHEEVVRVLLESNADVECCMRGGVSAVQLAAFSGYLGVVKLLVGAGADVNK